MTGIHTALDIIRALSLYSMFDESSDMLKLCQQEKKTGFIFLFPPTSHKTPCWDPSNIECTSESALNVKVQIHVPWFTIFSLIETPEAKTGVPP